MWVCTCNPQSLLIWDLLLAWSQERAGHPGRGPFALQGTGMTPPLTTQTTGRGSTSGYDLEDLQTRELMAPCYMPPWFGRLWSTIRAFSFRWTTNSSSEFRLQMSAQVAWGGAVSLVGRPHLICLEVSPSSNSHACTCSSTLLRRIGCLAQAHECHSLRRALIPRCHDGTRSRPCTEGGKM